MIEKVTDEAMKIAFANWILQTDMDQTQPLVNGLCWSLLCHADVVSERWAYAEIRFNVAVQKINGGFGVLFAGTFESSTDDIEAAKKPLKMLAEYLTSCFQLWESSTQNVDEHVVVVKFDWSLVQPFKI